jgi:membrane-bound lytic murein transglycosylase MltF
MSRINPSWKGDYDDMVKRRVIRVLVTYSKTFYFIDGVKQKGLSYEMIQSFEKHINRQQKKHPLKVNVFIIPVARDELLPALIEGRGDIAVANLTMTESRLKQVDFSEPFLKDVSEILVTGPGTAAIESLADTAGMEVHVRPSSSYYESLQTHQQKLKKAGLEPMQLHKADENLEDEDLLEMLNAGHITALVMDSHKAAFWKQIFKEIHLHSTCPCVRRAVSDERFAKKPAVA